MKRKLFAMLLTAALVAAQGVTALAAGSAEAGNQVITDSEGNTVAAVVTPGATVESMGGAAITTAVDTYLSSSVNAETKEAVKAQLLEAAGGKVAAVLDSMNEDARATLAGVKMVPSLGVLDVVPAAGSNTVTMRVANIPAGAEVYALHLTKSGVWETISVTRSGDYVTLSSSNWSPVILVYKDADFNLSTSGRQSSPAGSTTPAGLVASPKTGVASDWSLWMGGAVVLLAISSVMFRKKEA